VLGATDGRLARGLSGNYVKVSFNSQLAPNTIVRARVTRAAAGGVDAVPETH
jgi:hypothetical protein